MGAFCKEHSRQPWYVHSTLRIPDNREPDATSYRHQIFNQKLFKKILTEKFENNILLISEMPRLPEVQ